MTGLVALAVLGAIDVQVTAAPCVDVDVAEVRRIAALELSTEAPFRDRPRSIAVHLGCSADAVAITVDDQAAPRPLVRRIALATVDAPARARTAALAITELVAASWREEAGAVAPRGPRLSVAAFALGRYVPGLVQWGGGLRVGVGAPDAFGVAVELSGESGRATVGLGAVDVSSLSGALTAHRSVALGAFELLPSAGVRLGYVAARGSPASELVEGATLAGPWLGVLLAFRVEWALPHAGVVSFRLAATLEGGYAVLGVRALAAGQRAGGLDGPWAQATLGVAAGW